MHDLSRYLDAFYGFVNVMIFGAYKFALDNIDFRGINKYKTYCSA